jgi:tetratricopeptide (TPR) repeat protein
MPMVALGRLEIGVGNIEDALNWANKAVAADPSHPISQTLLADCYRLRDQFKEAEATYRTAIELDFENVAAQIGLANTLRDLCTKARVPKDCPQLAQAIPIYLEALRKHPDDAKVIFEYGRALELLDRLEAALQLYRDAVKLDSDDPRPHLAIVKAFIEAPSPDIAAAKQSLKKAEELNAALPDVRFWSARILFTEGNYPEAQREMETAVNAQPANALYHYWLGKILLLTDSLYEGLGELERAIQLNNRLGPAYRELGRAEASRNRFTEARKYYEEYRKVAPEDWTIHNDIGRSYLKQEKLAEAKSHFKKVLQEDPGDARAHTKIGEIAAREGDDKKAIESYERACKFNPNSGDACCNYGVAAAANAEGPVPRQIAEVLRRCLALGDEGDADLKELKDKAQRALDGGE